MKDQNDVVMEDHAVRDLVHFYQRCLKAELLRNVINVAT